MYSLKAMERGKHVFVEKPIAVSIEDAEIMREAAQESDVCYMVGFTQRFREGYILLKDLLDSGKLGQIINIFSYRIGAGPGFGENKVTKSWRTDPELVCGMSIESLSHDIDFIMSLAGDITDVRASTKGTLSELPAFDNNSSVVMNFSSGATGIIHASWSSHIAFNMRGIIGTKGTGILQGDDIWDFMEMRVKTEDMQYESSMKIKDIFFEGPAYYKENKYFIECIKNNTKPDVDAAAGLKTLQVSHAVLKSHKENAAVIL